MHSRPTLASPFIFGLAVLPLVVGLSAPAVAGDLEPDERLACTRALEDVRWQLREWPATNPGPKPALSELLSHETLTEKALDPLRMSTALEELWQRPLTAVQLQAEIDRMAAASRRPEALAALFEALDRDAYRVAECLARPLLAERLVRDWYASDDRFHGALRQRAEDDLAAVRTAAELGATSADYREVEWVSAASEARSTRTGSGAIELEGDRWAELVTRLGDLVGARELDGASLPALQVAPLQEDAERFWTVAILESGPRRIRAGVAEWRKEPFDSWWERQRSDLTPASASDPGYRFSLPSVPAGELCEDDTWEPTPAVPDPREDHVAVWTGNEMLIWGGNLLVFATGGRYEPSTDTWLPIAIAGEPADRIGFTGFWTGSEMLVWGGWGGGTSTNVLRSGGRYDPLTDSWTPTSLNNAPAARWLHGAVWTGDEMIVWGGCTALICGYLGNGGRYDPASDSWTATSTVGAPAARGEHTAAWTGAEMIVWGGAGSAGFLASGGRYDPLSNSWNPTSTVGAPAGRSVHTAVWSGSEMIVWGGTNGARLDSGGTYDPASDTWQATSTVGAPGGRRFHTAIWTGEEMIVWGGCVDSDCSNHRNTGGRYEPVSDTWNATATGGAPSPRSRHTAIWTGSEMIIWGGCSSGECQIELSSGGRYDPSTNSWVPTGSPAAPSPRVNHTAVWTGNEMIAWGGLDELDQSLTGARYDPATDVWTPTAIDGTAGARDSHTAVWTGSEMVVWGGVRAGIGTSRTGARYDPVSNSWTATNSDDAPEARMLHTAIWTGSEMLVWGGCRFQGCASFWSSGGRYHPASDTWRLTTLAGAPEARFSHQAVWSGSEMIVWGGSDGTVLDSGGRYAPASDSWTPTAVAGAPAARGSLAAVWSDNEMIVWGGTDGVGVFGDGGRYDPTANSWSPVTLTGAPEARRGHTGVWTGSEMLVWGGCSDPSCLAFEGSEFLTTGGRYDPAADVWSATSTLQAPFGRNLHTAVWTDEQMIAWGGWRGSTGLFTDTGGAYCASGGAGGVPDIDVTPVVVNFFSVPAGTTVSETVTISNVGTADLTVERVADLTTPLDLAADACTGTVLPPGGSCDVVVEFSPTEPVMLQAPLRIGSDDPDEERIAIRIRAQAVAP